MDDAQMREAALDAAIEEYRRALLPPDWATRKRPTFEEMLALCQRLTEREAAEARAGVGRPAPSWRCRARDR